METHLGWNWCLQVKQTFYDIGKGFSDFQTSLVGANNSVCLLGRSSQPAC